ncbi:MAG: 50S ribosomal protein L18 [Caldilineaceae bacterium]|nr:50S ribosomal protein L18 [Caldilineaceae bacterium]MCY4090270.1 50S ribosomal protein L18 [Caldilineaceae bacterium]MCY4119252.1 50S ribosomal protein L18 [Caldilineaceae bacterium]MDE0069545.1 50S ribosomal protein L18 [Caldilineaceae bacterium]MDE0182323.1 50S ribosomal protein L18 [Caldilineaceae bacterium]
MAKETRAKMRKRRHKRVRRKVFGTAARPRLNVFRSLKHTNVQVIDDQAGHTLVSASTLEAGLQEELADKLKVEQAKEVGKVVAARAKDAGIERVVFDRGGYRYHGRVKAVADGSREGGLVF